MKKHTQSAILWVFIKIADFQFCIKIIFHLLNEEIKTIHLNSKTLKQSCKPIWTNKNIYFSNIDIL